MTTAEPSCGAMWLRLLLVDLLFANVKAFAPSSSAPIQWKGLPGRTMVLMPRAPPNSALVSHTAAPCQALMISDLAGVPSPDDIPHFAARPDKTIAWEATGSCIEASGDKSGDEVQMNHCTGGATQQWDVLPTGNAHETRIQLHHAKVCIDVARYALNGAPIKLRDCDQATAEWSLGSPSPIPALNLSPLRDSPDLMRHMVMTFASLSALGALSACAWSWRRQKQAHAVAVSRGVVSLSDDLGGVCMLASIKPIRRSCPCKMAAISQIKADMITRNNAPVAKEVAFTQKVDVPEGLGEPAQTHVLEDEYQWMRGSVWPNETVEDEDIISHLNAENAYCKEFMTALDEQKTSFFEAIKGRIKLTDKTLESKEGDFFYYARTEERLQYSIDCRRKVDSSPDDAGAEQILLDRNVLAEGQKFCEALSTMVSGDGKLMAYRCDLVGDENYRLRFQNIETKEYLPDEMWNVDSYCFHESLASDAPPVGIFYVVRNEELRPTKLWYHKFGTDVKDDKLVFASKNDMFTVTCGRSSDKEFVVVDYGSKTENESYAIDVRDMTKQFPDEIELKLLKGMKPDIEYSVDHGAGYWYMSTKEGCKKEHFRVLRSSADCKEVSAVAESDNNPHEERASSNRAELPGWEVNVEEDPELCLTSGCILTKDHLSLGYLNTKTGQPKLVVRPIAAGCGESWQTISFPGIDAEKTSHSADFSHTTNYKEGWIQVAVDTPVYPTRWYRYTYGQGSEGMQLLKQNEVPNYDPSLYECERFYAEYTEDLQETMHPSKHETEKAKNPSMKVSIPITVFYKKEKFYKNPAEKDGSMPLLLNGYGSYGISEDPEWSNLSTLYADLGFVVATAHIRGGGDLGEPWYQAAKFLTKKRTFQDFVKCAEKLVEHKYTSYGNVAICGGSAGGMLVGACLNLKPFLFRAVLAHVPFVTVLDTMLDSSLPLTPGEFKEWGNPRDPGYFQYMRSYCPYENLEVEKALLESASDASGKKKFPSIFATAGLSDFRVGYYEATKWIARIRKQIKQAKEKDANVKEPMVIIETNMAAGHGGASGRFDRIKEVSRDVAFLVSEFGITPDANLANGKASSSL